MGSRRDPAVAPEAQDLHERLNARFNNEQIDCIARGFARAIEESSYVLLACAILPDHVHAVIERAIEYDNRNPTKMGLAPQDWWFVRH